MSRAQKIRRVARKVLLGLVAVVVLLLAVFLIFKDPILKAVALYQVREETGMEVVIGKLETSLRTGQMTLSGFQLRNPPEFGGEIFIDIPEVHLELDGDAAWDGRVRFKVLRLNLAEAQVVKNKEGKTNLEFLEEHSKERARLKKKKRNPHEKTTVYDGIEIFYFSLGTVKYTDLGHPRNNQVIEAGLKDEMAKDLKTAEDLNDWITTKLFTVVLGELLKSSGGKGLKGLLF